MRQKAIVIDLDCTLLTINTFKSYILYVNKLSYRKGRIDISFFLTMWVLLRKCRIISHEYMKYQILKCTEHFMKEKSLKDFTNLIIKHLNKKLVEKISIYRKQNFILCLSTAAPSNYASLVAKEFSFDIFCATPMPSQISKFLWQENVKGTKCKNTLNLLKKKNLDIDILVTDHYDDIPLLEIQKSENLIVNPTQRTLEKLEEKNIKFKILE